MIKITVKGLKRVNSSLNKLEKSLVDYAYNEALQDLGEKIGEISKAKVPVDKGILKSSFSIQKVNKSWVVGYNTEYAIYQHQGKDKQGNRIIRDRPGGGQSFFLSEPLKTNKKELLDFLQQRFEFYIKTKIKSI